MGDVHVTVA